MLKAAGLEYEIAGEGEPVLLIHGSFVCDADLPLMWQPALTSRYRLIRYHRRGYAGSAPHDGPFSIEEQAQDALALLRALGISRAHVSGHSYGGLIALQLALAAPDAVHSLALREPALGALTTIQAGSPSPALVRNAHLDQYRGGDTAGALDTFFLNIVGTTDWRADLARMLPDAPRQVEDDARTFFEVESKSFDVWRFDAEIASHISQPVLCAIGTEPPYGPNRAPMRQRLHDLLPQTEDFDLPGASHMLQSHSPEHAALMAEGIAEFLAKNPLS